MEESSFFKKLNDWISKDTSNENETAQFLIMLRYICIVFFIYFLAFTISIAISDSAKLAVAGLFWPAILIVLFISTYKFQRRHCFHLYSTAMLVWMFVMVVLYGWDVGIQIFIMPLVVVSFFATYENIRGKVIYLVFLFLFRMFMFVYFQNFGAKVLLGSETELTLQIISTIFSLVEMFVVCYIFSTTNQAANEKLAFYNQKLKRESETDTLTGLMNRRCMYSVIEKSMAENKLITVAMCDIDFFKRVNDTLGHECGDEVLVQLSSYFRKYMEDKGTVCRWGGEEFVFVFDNMNGDDAFMKAEHIRKHIEDMVIFYNNLQVKVTITFGVEEFDHKQSFSELIKKADDKLYIGKQKGRNCVIY